MALRRLVSGCAAAVLALCVIPASGNAQRVWQEGEVLSDNLRIVGPDLALSEDGTAFVVWSERRGDARVLNAAVKVPGRPLERQRLERSDIYAKVVADREGNALVVSSGGGGTAYRSRSGGPFGPPERLPFDIPQYGVVAVVTDGDGNVAIVHRRPGETPRAFDVSWGTVTGGFSAPVPLIELHAADVVGDVRLTRTGDLVFPWVAHSSTRVTSPGPVRVAVRGRADSAPTIQTLSDPWRVAYLRGSGVDHDGDAIVAWYDHEPGDDAVTARFAERSRGEPFGAARDLTRLTGFGDDFVTAMTADGTVSFVDSTSVWSMQPQGTPRLVNRTAEDFGHAQAPFAAESFGNHIVFARRPDGKHAVSLSRTGDGDVTPPVDMNPGCLPTTYVQVALTDGGQAAALLWHPDYPKLLSFDTAGSDSARCLEQPPAPEQPPTPEQPPAPDPTPTYSGRVGVTNAQVTRARKYRMLAADIDCGAPACTVTATARLQLKGLGVVGRGRRALSLSGGGTLRVKVPLTSKMLKKIDRFRKASRRNRKRRFELVALIRSEDGTGAKTSKSVRLATR